MLTQVTQKNLTDTSDHSAVTLSEVYEECLVLGKVDPRELVLPLSVSERVPADHLESLHVAEVLVKCCVPVHRELHQLAAILDPSFVIVTVRLLQTLGLASVPAE